MAMVRTYAARLPCYFSDDLAANVDAARATGMDAEQFTTA